jgi:hypothetical protein
MGLRLQVPLEVKSPGFVPLMVKALVMVKGALPLEVNTVVWVALHWPTATFPKDCDGGARVMPAVPPEPVSGS